MKCKIKECTKEATYKTQRVCQKHYFRFMRNGQYQKLTNKQKKPRPKTGRVYRRQNAKGYQKIHKPDHPLVMSDEYVYEHRFVVYEDLGDVLPDCQCGKKITWQDCHIDHIDEDVTNNELSNLRPSCNWCNVKRGYKGSRSKYESTISITYQNDTKTPAEWARDKRVKIKAHTIRQRWHRGWPTEDILFKIKLTHNNNK